MSRSSRAVACDDIEPRSSDGDDTEARARRRRRDDARRDVVMSRCHHRLLPPSLPSRVKAAARIRPIRPASSHTSRAPHGETGLSPHASRPTRNARAEMSSPAAPRMIHQRAVDPPPLPPPIQHARSHVCGRAPARRFSLPRVPRAPARPFFPPPRSARRKYSHQKRVCVRREGTHATAARVCRPRLPSLVAVADSCAFRVPAPWDIFALECPN